MSTTKKTSPPSTKRSVISWNINGARAISKKNTIVPYLNEHAPDYVCLQEVRAQDSQSLSPILSACPAYRILVFHPSVAKKGYAGVAILAHARAPNPKTTQCEHDEGRLAVCVFEDWILATTYVPNAGQGLARWEMRTQTWDPWFQTYLAKLQTAHPTKCLLVGGDFNVAHREIDLARPRANTQHAGFTQEERIGFDALLEKTKLVDVWRARNPSKVEYTWWSYLGGARKRNVGWRIDYWLISSAHLHRVEEMVHDTSILGSDHCPLRLTFR